jgi:hypothetical protein
MARPLSRPPLTRYYYIEYMIRGAVYYLTRAGKPNIILDNAYNIGIYLSPFTL